MNNLIPILSESVQFLQKKFPQGFHPEIALILGSGLGDFVKDADALCKVSYGEIPGFVSSSVSGHKGELICGELNGKKLLLFSGRIHFYEGHSLQQTTLPIRCIAKLGIKKLLLTSAVGAVNKKFRAGDIVVVKDHINFMGTNPLLGPHEPSVGERFPDMTECYSKHLQKLALILAKKNKVRAHSGVYFGLTGPSYETPAEIRAFRKLGADVVGMSMVPEAMVARQMGLETLGLCYISNMAAGILNKTLHHSEVLEVGKQAAKKLSILIREIVKNI